MTDLATVKGHVEDFLNNTEFARILSERDRDYKDHKQWTAEEEARLRARNQAAIVVNRIKPKVEGLKGLLISRRTDPKALPRTKHHEKAAEAITDALRFVNDNVDLDQIELDVADNVFVEGYGAAITEVKRRGDEREITVTHIPWDRYYFDVHSRRLSFQDKRYDGIIIWMDYEEVQEIFGVETDYLLYGDGSGTFDDRPRWIDTTRKRVRVCQHFYKREGVWWMCYFTASGFLIEPMVSPYLDDNDQPVNPIEAVSANIDRDNNRFGEVRYWIDLQDEINHRRSKFLHMLSVRQTAAARGAIPDIPALKRELAKPDGHVEYTGEKGAFEVLNTGDMAEAQLMLLQDSKNELDSVGFNAQLSGERQGDLSGRAISNLQSAAMNELSSLYAGLNSWKKRIYTQIWYRIRQFWDEETWIRILDDQSRIRWVGLNQQITVQQLLEEQINDESLDLRTRQEAAALFQKMMQSQDPRLNEITEVRNDVAELSVDINIETALDTPNIQAEQFELLAAIAQGRSEIPFAALLRLSSLRDKDAIIKEIEAQQQAAGQAAQQVQAIEQMKVQVESAEKAAKAKKYEAEIQKLEQESIQTMIQNHLLVEQPPKDSAVVL